MKYVIASLLVLGAMGCKQGEGERCQVTADCKDPLVCVVATMTCQRTMGEQIDTILPIDAAPDAPTDAPTDAPHE